jgi:hypothetical protein
VIFTLRVTISPENIDFTLFAGGGFGGGFPSVETLFTAIAAKGVL